MGKPILYILLGVITGGLVVYLVESLGHFIYPPPETLKINDPETLKNYLNNTPPGSIFFVILAWALGSLTGGLVTALIISNGKIKNAMIVGMIMMVFGIFNLFLLPSPNWFTLLGIVIFIPFSYGGGVLAVKLKTGNKD